MPDDKNCEWEGDGEDCYSTDCGKAFEFNDGSAADNGFEFCPFCGGHIIIANESDS